MDGGFSRSRSHLQPAHEQRDERVRARRRTHVHPARGGFDAGSACIHSASCREKRVVAAPQPRHSEVSERHSYIGADGRVASRSVRGGGGICRGDGEGEGGRNVPEQRSIDRRVRVAGVEEGSCSREGARTDGRRLVARAVEDEVEEENRRGAGIDAPATAVCVRGPGAPIEWRLGSLGRGRRSGACRGGSARSAAC